MREGLAVYRSHSLICLALESIPLSLVCTTLTTCVWQVSIEGGGPTLGMDNVTLCDTLG